MADRQLDLFNRKKYTGILPQTVEITPPTSDSTVLTTLPAYHPYLSSGGYSKYTPDDFTSDVKKFGMFLKDKRIGEIRTTDIQQWIAELKKVLSAKTVSRKVSALSNYFLWLVSVGVLDHKTNPAGTIRYTRVTSPLPDILFESECQTLLKASSSDPRTYFLVLLLLGTGLKKEELFELKTVNFDLSNRYAPELWVKHTGKKVSKDRKLKLPAELAPVYEEYVKKYGINEIVFPYTPRFIEMLLAGVAKRANLQKKVTAGILRDTCAIRQLRRGEGIELVLQRLGLSETIWEDAKIKHLKLSAGGL
jgi:site-specific recombinase XerD